MRKQNVSTEYYNSSDDDSDNEQDSSTQNTANESLELSKRQLIEHYTKLKPSKALLVEFLKLHGARSTGTNKQNIATIVDLDLGITSSPNGLDINFDTFYSQRNTKPSKTQQRTRQKQPEPDTYNEPEPEPEYGNLQDTPTDLASELQTELNKMTINQLKIMYENAMDDTPVGLRKKDIIDALIPVLMSDS